MATRYFFVDEAGDLTLFDKRGRSMLGREGVSRYFMVGVAEICNPTAVTQQLDMLRLKMLGDPYFALAPSLDPERRRTALSFHAKDDLPEVRWRVYKRLRELDIKVTVAVRHKKQLEMDARMQFESKGIKLRPDDVYDSLVTRLFTKRLTQKDEHRIVFAIRKKSYRNISLTQAVERAWTHEATERDALRDPKLVITSCKPAQTAGLQVVDYFLWAVQRLFERNEDRFYAGMEQRYEGVIEIDGSETNAEGSGSVLRLRAS